MRALYALAALLAGARCARALASTSESGCPCISTCSRTIDSPFVKMCTTSEGPTANPALNRTCGSYSSIRNAYWEACNITSAACNITSAACADSTSSALPRVPLTTFADMWKYICVSAGGGVAAVYALVGLALLLLLARTAWDLPSSAPMRGELVAHLVRSPLYWLAFVLVGGLHGFLPGASLAAILSYMYLSMPYAIDSSVAIILGLMVAAVALFFALNRLGGGLRTNRHASAYDEC